MAEREIATEEAFSLCESKRGGKRCMVVCCQRKKEKDRLICAGHRKQLYRLRNPLRAAYQESMNSARKRKIAFRLSFAEFAGVLEGTNYLEQKGIRAWNLHIDRIESSKGYEVGNVRVITASENCRKAALTERSNSGPKVAELVEASDDGLW